MRYLTTIRRVFAALFFFLLLLFFLDFSEGVPTAFHALAHIQIVPALLNGFFIGVGLVLLLTFMAGRWYCSFICPLGILQDLMLRLVQWVRKVLPSVKTIRFRYSKPLNRVRYLILVITVLSYAFGSIFLLTLLDPYSAFGKIVYTIAKPIYLAANNLLAALGQRAGFEGLSVVSIDPAPLQMWIYVALILTIVLTMVSFRGRLFCNTLCPVGAGLSLFSSKSRMGIVIDKERCNGCKKCVSRCKAECIDSENHKTDMSRCVVCFNCIDSCKQSAVSYRILPSAKKEIPLTDDSSAQENKQTRKEFLKTLSVGSVLLTGLSACGSENSSLSSADKRYPIPAGAVSLDRFMQKCTACQLCVSKCPSGVLKPAFLENGIIGVMQPYLKFDTHRFCEYECTKCIEVCPNGALTKLSLEEKKLTQIGIVRFHQEACQVYKDEMFCGVCAEHCPTQAIRMIDYKEGLTIPLIDISYCIGCGACESICPQKPNAIFVQSIKVHQSALPPSVG